MAAASEVRRPRVIAERRRVADRIALGDTATLEDGPALLWHLRAPAPGQTFALGTAIHPLTTIRWGWRLTPPSSPRTVGRSRSPTCAIAPLAWSASSLPSGRCERWRG